MKKLAGLPAKFYSTGFCRNDRNPTEIGGALIRPLVVVIAVIVVIAVVGISIGSGGGGGGGGRSNGDGCDVSHMINKHMLHKQTTGIPLHSVPVNSAEHSGLNSGMPIFRWNDQAPE